jgi:ADP-ribose pyrophosphatase YjhB (NUDIX family)
MAAGALFRDGQGRVLLVDPVYKPVWDLPGGAVEAEESPHAACRREVGEELGLDRPPGRVLAVDWVPSRPDRPEGVVVIYDGGVLSGEDIAAIARDHVLLQPGAVADHRAAADHGERPGLTAVPDLHRAGRALGVSGDEHRLRADHASRTGPQQPGPGQRGRVHRLAGREQLIAHCLLLTPNVMPGPTLTPPQGAGNEDVRVW